MSARPPFEPKLAGTIPVARPRSSDAERSSLSEKKNHVAHHTHERLSSLVWVVAYLSGDFLASGGSE